MQPRRRRNPSDAHDFPDFAALNLTGTTASIVRSWNMPHTPRA
jgi:hypothetical protein